MPLSDEKLKTATHGAAAAVIAAMLLLVITVG
jgi:hypothetical protein